MACAAVPLGLADVSSLMSEALGEADDGQPSLKSLAEGTLGMCAPLAPGAAWKPRLE